MAESPLTASLKQIVFERARGCCEYCRSPARFAMQPFSVEHIEPRSRQGAHTLDNLALACQGCNNHKYTKTEGCDPITGERVALYHPRRQRWSEHFAWKNYCTRIVGLTPGAFSCAVREILSQTPFGVLRYWLYSGVERTSQNWQSQF